MVSLSRSPPVALQPSLGHYYAHVNNEWKKGYEIQTSRSGKYLSDPLLSRVVVISISGGYNDYQVFTSIGLALSFRVILFSFICLFAYNSINSFTNKLKYFL